MDEDYLTIDQMENILISAHCRVSHQVLQTWFKKEDMEALSQEYGAFLLKQTSRGVIASFPKLWFGTLIDQNRDFIHQKIQEYYHRRKIDSDLREEWLYSTYSADQTKSELASFDEQEKVENSFTEVMAKLASKVLNVDYDKLFDDITNDQIEFDVLKYLDNTKNK